MRYRRRNVLVWNIQIRSVGDMAIKQTTFLAILVGFAGCMCFWGLIIFLLSVPYPYREFFKLACVFAIPWVIFSVLAKCVLEQRK